MTIYIRNGEKTGEKRERERERKKERIQKKVATDVADTLEQFISKRHEDRPQAISIYVRETERIIRTY